MSPTLAPLAPLDADVGRWSALDVLGVCLLAYLVVAFGLMLADAGWPTLASAVRRARAALTDRQTAREARP